MGTAGAAPHRRRLRAVIATVASAVTLALLIGGLIATMTLRAWARATDDRRDLLSAARAVSDLRLALSDQETGVRGYVLTGDATFLDPYEAGKVAETTAVERLTQRRLIVAGGSRLLAVATAAAAAWRTDVAEPQIATRRDGRPIDPSTVEAGKARFDVVRETLTDLDRNVDEASRRATARSKQMRKVVAIVGGGIAAIMATTVIALLAALRRWVTRPLAEVDRAARAIGRGEEERMPRFGTAELNAVSDAVEFLQSSLTQERDRAVRAYAGLEQSALLALHVRSELVADERPHLADGWSIATGIRPAEGLVAGDCFDVGLVNPQTLYAVLIDVTGHGAVAALNALKAKSVLRSAVKSGMEPGTAIDWLFRHAAGPDDMEYFTAFVALVELATGRCRYANAGHPPAVVTGRSPVTTLGRTGPLVGPFPATWSTEETVLDAGASLVIYSDGLTEAIAEDGQRLGETRVLDVLSGTLGDADAVFDTVGTLYASFRRRRQPDDASLVVLHREIAAEPVPAERVGSVLADGR